MNSSIYTLATRKRFSPVVKTTITEMSVSRKTSIKKAQLDYAKLIQRALASGTKIEYRVKDAPNSVWMDFSKNDIIDTANEEYRVK